ncbi:MAG: cytochrome c [Deltaproteobacteria bacterium]|nr:cytochrome c [Deltaproteobacteria bacterium]
MSGKLAGCLAAAAAVATGCMDFDEPSDYPCPPQGTALTWDNFGSGFMAQWCVRCHGGPNGYSSRALNNREAVQANLQRVFVNAAAGNTTMPPGPDDPPRAERDKLAQWLACGAK